MCVVCAQCYEMNLWTLYRTVLLTSWVTAAGAAAGCCHERYHGEDVSGTVGEITVGLGYCCWDWSGRTLFLSPIPNRTAVHLAVFSLSLLPVTLWWNAIPRSYSLRVANPYSLNHWLRRITKPWYSLYKHFASNYCHVFSSGWMLKTVPLPPREVKWVLEYSILPYVRISIRTVLILIEWPWYNWALPKSFLKACHLWSSFLQVFVSCVVTHTYVLYTVRTYHICVLSCIIFLPRPYINNRCATIGLCPSFPNGAETQCSQLKNPMVRSKRTQWPGQTRWLLFRKTQWYPAKPNGRRPKPNVRHQNPMLKEEKPNVTAL